jgi:hypothetical protein
VVRKAKKATKTPSEDDWQQAISAFKHHYNLDDSAYRNSVKQLASELEDESKSANDTAALIEDGEPATPLLHDGSAILLRIEKKGRTVEQIALAKLDLVALDLEKGRRHYGLMVFPNEVIKVDPPIFVGEVARQLRAQAKRLRAGAKRVRRCLDDYKQRRDAIKPVRSVAWDVLIATTEPWAVQPMDISRRIARAVRHPSMRDRMDEDEHARLWNDNLKNQQTKWHERHPEKQGRARKT